MNRDKEIEMLKGLCKLITDRYRLCELYEKDCTNISKWYASPSVYVIWGKSIGTNIYNKRQILSTEFGFAKERLIDVLNSDQVIRSYLKDLDIYEINPDYIRANIDCIWSELSKTKFTQSIKTMYGLNTKKVRKGQVLDRAFTE